MSESRVVRVCAPAGDRFTRAAIAGMVGDEVPLKVEDETISIATVRAVELADAGRSILLTLEADRWPDGLVATFQPESVSLAPR